MQAQFPWSAPQRQALDHKGSLLIVGAAGSGKTLLLLSRAARTAARQPTALATFAFRNQEYLHAVAGQNFKGVWEKLTTGTLADLAAAQLKSAGHQFRFASNNQVREILRGLMAEQAFAGTLEDAEHIIRSAKVRAKKLPENDRNYPFFEAYRARMEQLDLTDRHDLIRRHVRGMMDGSIQPLPVKHLLVENIHDATELQLIWLQQHLNAGVELTLTADDDQTAFTSDGAFGASGVAQAREWEGVHTVTLEQTFRIPQSIAPVVAKVARQLRHRTAKDMASDVKTAATIRAEVFPHAPAEHAFLAETCLELARQGQTVGIVTRTHLDAALLTHALRKYGQGQLNPASFARLIWEEPTPQLILAMLYVLLGEAMPAHLYVVMLGFGIPADAAADLLDRGLTPKDWLSRGCPLPPLAEGVSPTTQANLQQIRQAFRAAAQLLHARALGAREVFKTLVAQLLEHLPPAEQPQALLATDMLLSLSGKLADILPRVRTETLPDMASRVTVAPVREVRNREFSTVILPYMDARHWPQPASPLLPPDSDHERHLFYLAISRTAGNLILTRHAPEASPFVTELQQSLKQQAKKA